MKFTHLYPIANALSTELQAGPGRYCRTHRLLTLCQRLCPRPGRVAGPAEQNALCSVAQLGLEHRRPTAAICRASSLMMSSHRVHFTPEREGTEPKSSLLQGSGLPLDYSKSRAHPQVLFPPPFAVPGHSAKCLAPSKTPGPWPIQMNGREPTCQGGPQAGAAGVSEPQLCALSGLSHSVLTAAAYHSTISGNRLRSTEPPAQGHTA